MPVEPEQLKQHQHYNQKSKGKEGVNQSPKINTEIMKLNPIDLFQKKKKKKTYAKKFRKPKLQANFNQIVQI